MFNPVKSSSVKVDAKAWHGAGQKFSSSEFLLATDLLLRNYIDLIKFYHIAKFPLIGFIMILNIN